MKVIRIIILLLILVFVAFYSKLQRLQTTAWIEPLAVAIYPINVDGQKATADYINALSIKDFKSINHFFDTQWGNYSELDYQPVAIELMPALEAKPPAPPTHGNMLKIMLWSLQLRYWAYQHSEDTGRNTVRIYIQYQQVDSEKPLSHSLGLQKGLIGIVNAYANSDYQETNNIIIAHELLHTVGATDKYDLSTGQPIYPDGFAVAENNYQQHKAEIMAGKVPISETESEMPYSLLSCIIGNKTAIEIGWLDKN